MPSQFNISPYVEQKRSDQDRHLIIDLPLEYCDLTDEQKTYAIRVTGCVASRSMAF